MKKGTKPRKREGDEKDFHGSVKSLKTSTTFDPGLFMSICSVLLMCPSMTADIEHGCVWLMINKAS